MAKIFKLFSEQTPAQEQKKTISGANNYEELFEEKGLEPSKESVKTFDIKNNYFNDKDKYADKSDLQAGDIHDFNRDKIMKMYEVVQQTIMDQRQFARLLSIKAQIKGLEEEMSKPAYNQYYLSLSEKSLKDLLPILDSTSDLDLFSRPVYARAFVTVVEEKYKIEVAKKRMEMIKPELTDKQDDNENSAE